MGTESLPKQRPYWHVDAKWITGLLLVVMLSLTFLVYNLIQITAEEPAVRTTSMALALVFSRNGLDDPTEIEEFRQRLRASPDGAVAPIPGLAITVREADIANLSPREARLHLFRRLATPLYRDGPQGLADLAEDPETKQVLSAGVGPLSLFSLQTHQALRRVFGVLVAISLGLVLLLVFFSYRFGRLGSPGCVFFAASLPGAVFLTFLSLASGSQDIPAPPGEGAELTDMVGYLAANLLPPLVQEMSRTYLLLLGFGFGLMVLAILGSIIWRLARRG
ncbi:MAG: hypothetical protein IT330_19195 [Anaerolineae bacterium]|nr:hypothetical protein [Anaerolineae bacterium]